MTTTGATEVHERRFIVTKLGRGAPRKPALHIRQGYFSEQLGLEARIVTEAGGHMHASLTRKHGVGQTRRKQPLEGADLRTVEFLLDTPGITEVRKTRCIEGDWYLDRFEGRLAGLRPVAEVRTAREGGPIEFPSWMLEYVEVTGWLTNRHLAYLAEDLHDDAAGKPLRTRILATPPLTVALVSGPGGGKSTVLEAIQDAYGDDVQCCPETASYIIGTVKAPPPSDRVDVRRYQRRLYTVQRAVEDASRAQAMLGGRRLLVTDRGTLDGAAYLAGGLPEFTRACRTTVAEELARYDAVIFLEVPPRQVYDQIRRNNASRSESHRQAVRRGDRTKDAWSGHRTTFHIGNYPTMRQKTDRVLQILERLLAARAAAA